MIANGSTIYFWIVFSHSDVGLLYCGGKKSLVCHGFLWRLWAGIHLRISTRGLALWPCRSSLDVSCIAALATYQVMYFLAGARLGPWNEEVGRIKG